MDTAISSSCTKKSGIPTIGKKAQSLAGCHKISFYGSVCCLHLRAKKSAAQIGYPERQSHRSCTRRVNRLIFLHVLFSDW
jgi:hypothetical protein